MAKLSDMKNPETCKHTRIALETIYRYKIPQGYEELMKQEDLDMEEYRSEEPESVTRCLECGMELGSSVLI